MGVSLARLAYVLPEFLVGVGVAFSTVRCLANGCVMLRRVINQEFA
jgi:hypothetical protein